jgi:hypothetical protein
MRLLWSDCSLLIALNCLSLPLAIPRAFNTIFKCWLFSWDLIDTFWSAISIGDILFKLLMALNNLSSTTSWGSSYWSSNFLLRCQTCQRGLIWSQLWLCLWADHSWFLLLRVLNGLIHLLCSCIGIWRWFSSCTLDIWPWAILIDSVILSIVNRLGLS